MDNRNFILQYLLENYYRPNLSAEMSRLLDLNEDQLLDLIDIINRDKNGLIVLKEGMGKNKFVISLRPNSEEEVKTFLANGGYSSLQSEPTENNASAKKTEEISFIEKPKTNGSNAFKWIAIVALIISLIALAVSVYNYLLIGGYL